MYLDGVQVPLEEGQVPTTVAAAPGTAARAAWGRGVSARGVAARGQGHVRALRACGAAPWRYRGSERGSLAEKLTWQIRSDGRPAYYAGLLPLA